MKTKSVRTLYKGKVAVSSKMIDACVENGEGIRILHDGKEMIVPPCDLSKFKCIDKKVYTCQFSHSSYTLKYIPFKADQGVLF